MPAPYEGRWHGTDKQIVYAGWRLQAPFGYAIPPRFPQVTWAAVDVPALQVVTLITDFGWQDSYVGQLKGKLLQTCARILPVDLNHSIPPWDIDAAARCLFDSYSFFPRGTVHLVVVDPGVGSERRLLAASGGGHLFVAPDNGTLSCLLNANRIEQAHQLALPADAATPSNTFHGRDIMAPAAGRLACGCSLTELGHQLPLHTLVRLQDLPNINTLESPSCLNGTVLSVDRFGNVRTSFHPLRDNISRSHLSALTINNIVVREPVNCYSEARPATFCYLIDSGGYIEIALNQGNAAQTIPCMPGDPIQLHLNSNHTLSEVAKKP